MAKPRKKNEYLRRGISASLLALILSLTIASLLTPLRVSAAENETIGDRKITLVCPDINSGESMVRIGDNKYIRYSITIEEYKSLAYSRVSFTVTYDSPLALYATNIDLGQPYAYDAPAGEKKAWDNITFSLSQEGERRLAFTAESEEGFYFDGPALILYFLPPDSGQIGSSAGLTLGDFSASILGPGNIPDKSDNYTISARSGRLTLTGERSYSSGTPNLTDEPTPNPEKGPGESPGDPDRRPGVASRGIFNYVIAFVIIALLGISVFAGIRIVRKMLRIN